MSTKTVKATGVKKTALPSQPDKETSFQMLKLL
jgi:hypothetical protein